MTAIIYTRFSPRRNADKSESCETQEALCRAHAEAQGWPVGSVHADRGRSGKDADRPGLASALATLRRGDVLLVYKRDRIARQVLTIELTKRQVKAAGATIAAVSGDIAGDDNDPTVVFVRQVMDAVAELERKQIAVRTSDAMLQLQRQGRRMGRYAPYGWKVDPLTAMDPKIPTLILSDPTEQTAMIWIRDLSADGLSISEIQKEMNISYREAARASSWSYNAVKRILAREM